MYIKHCTRCKHPKEQSEFNRSKRESDGLQDICRICGKEVGAIYRANNVEKEKERHARYSKENREKLNEYLKQWQKDNPEKGIKYRKDFYKNHKESELLRRKKYRKPEHDRKLSKEWREKNIEYARLYDSEYAKHNKDKVNVKQAKRRAAKKNAIVEWADKNKIRTIYAEAARLTKETGIQHHVDHIIPLLSKKVCGLHWEENLQILTAQENHIKCNKLLH